MEVEGATTVEEAGTTEDRANGGVEEGVELEEVGGEEDGQEEEQDSRQTTKISDTRMTSITKVIDILVIRIGLQEAEVSIVTVIRGLLIIRIHIKELGDMDQLALATITTSSKHLSSVIQGKLRKLLGFCVYPCLIMLFISHSAQIRLDMEEWNKSSMWPLSCYAYFRETPCLPGFADVSPEELRWEAYRAKASGNSEHYLKNVSQLNDERLKLMHEFSNLTKDDVRDMVSKSITRRGLASLAPCLYLIAVFVSVVK